MMAQRWFLLDSFFLCMMQLTDIGKRLNDAIDGHLSKLAATGTDCADVVPVPKRRRLCISSKCCPVLPAAVSQHYCDLCPFSIPWSGHLRDHKFRRHKQGSPRCKCKDCDYTCWSSQEMLKHRKSKHGLLVAGLPRCWSPRCWSHCWSPQVYRL